MAQLVVRKIEENVVHKLKELAGRHGISMEEEHRRILREALLGVGPKTEISFKKYLKTMPEVGGDELFERERELNREVSL